MADGAGGLPPVAAGPCWAAARQPAADTAAANARAALANTNFLMVPLLSPPPARGMARRRRQSPARPGAGPALPPALVLRRRPWRHDAVHARVGDRLPEVLVVVARDAHHGLRHERVAAEDLDRPLQIGVRQRVDGLV